MKNFTLTQQGEQELVMSRIFQAPRQLVFDAFTQPELVRRWLLGPGGWTMPVCEIDLRVGGSYRYVWRNAKGMEMGMGGIYLEIIAPERIVSTERFDESWYPGEAVGTLLLAVRNGITTMTQTLRYQSPEALQAVLKSGMEQGVEASFNRLADVLAAT